MSIQEAIKKLEELARAPHWGDGQRTELTKVYKALMNRGYSPEKAVQLWAETRARVKGQRGA